MRPELSPVVPHWGMVTQAPLSFIMWVLMVFANPKKVNLQGFYYDNRSSLTFYSPENMPRWAARFTRCPTALSANT